MMALTMISSMLLLLVVGVPVAIAIALAAMIGLVFFTNMPPLLIVAQYYNALDSFVLVAVPLFILAGNIMDTGGVARRLVDMALCIVGRLPGGLAATCVLTCLIFGSVSGSSVATTFAIGAILIPAMTRNGYPVGFGASLQAASAELAVIIPPSVAMIIYGVATNTSIGDLFIAGIGPGILIACVLMIAVVLSSVLLGYGSSGVPEVRFLPVFRDGLPALLMPVIVLGGIYGGVFTPTEAAVVAVFYALFLAAFIYRSVTWSGMYDVLVRSAISTSFIMFTIAAAGFFSFLLNLSGIGVDLTLWVNDTFSSPWSFLLAVNIMLLFIGMVLETTVAILVLGPLLAPIAAGLGIDPVHFGLVMIVNLAIGMLTPPLGVNLFAVCAVANVGIERIIPFIVPFIALLIFCLALITHFPIISVGIVGLL